MARADLVRRPRRLFVAGVLLALIASLVPFSAVLAVASVAPATGGGAISADTANTAWTALTGPVVTEGGAATFGNGTVVLNAPDGFRFRAGFGSVAFSGAGCTLSVGPGLTVIAATATFTISGAPSGAATCVLTYSALQVQPTAGAVTAGSITRSGAATGLPGGSYGTLMTVAGAPDHLAFMSYPAATGPAILTPQPSVAVADQFGNVVTTDSRAITLAINNASLEASPDVMLNTTQVTAARPPGPSFVVSV